MPKKKHKPVTMASFKQAAAELSGFSKPAPKVKKRRDPNKPRREQSEFAARKREALDSKTRVAAEQSRVGSNHSRPPASRSGASRTVDATRDAGLDVGGKARSGVSSRGDKRKALNDYPSGATPPDVGAHDGVDIPQGYPEGADPERPTSPVAAEGPPEQAPEYISPGSEGEHSPREHTGDELVQAEEERRHRPKRTHGHGRKRRRGKRKSRRHSIHHRRGYGSHHEGDEHEMLPHGSPHGMHAEDIPHPHAMPHPHDIPHPHRMGPETSHVGPPHIPIPHPVGEPVKDFSPYGRSYLAERERHLRHAELDHHERHRRRSRSRPRHHRRDEERRTHREHRHRGERRAHREHREHRRHRERGDYGEHGYDGKHRHHIHSRRRSHHDRHRERDHSPDLSDHRSSIRDAEQDNELLREGHELAPSRHSSDEEGPASLSVILPNDHDSPSDVENDRGSDDGDQNWDHDRSRGQVPQERESQDNDRGRGRRHSRESNRSAGSHRSHRSRRDEGIGSKIASVTRNVRDGVATRAVASAALGAEPGEPNHENRSIGTKLVSAARDAIASAGDKGGTSRSIVAGVTSAALGKAFGDVNGTAGEEGRTTRGMARRIASSVLSKDADGGGDLRRSNISHASERQRRRGNVTGAQHPHIDDYHSDSTAPSGDDGDYEPPIRRHTSSRKGDHAHRKGSSTRRHGRSRRARRHESTRGGDEDASWASEEYAVRMRTSKGARSSRGLATLKDVDELDSRASRRARDVMNNTEVPPGSMSILEKFLPAKTLPIAKSVVEASDVHGFLEMGENESLAEDAFQRESKNSPFHVEVPQNFSYIIERCGKFKRRIDAGWHVLLPFLDRVKFVHSLKEEPMPIPPHQAFTADDISVLASGVLFVKVVDPVTASYAVENPYRSLLILSQAVIKQHIGTRTLRLALSERPQMGEALEDEVNLVVRNWGLDVTRFEVTELEPPHEMRAMMQMEAESRFQREVQLEHAQNDLLRRKEMEHEVHAHETEQLTNIYAGHNESLDHSRGLPSAANVEPVWRSRNDEEDTANDPYLEETLSEQQALGASWHTHAALSTRRTNPTHTNEQNNVHHFDQGQHVHHSQHAQHAQGSLSGHAAPHEHSAEAATLASHSHHVPSQPVSARNAPASLVAGHDSTNGMWNPNPNLDTTNAPPPSQASHAPAFLQPVYTTVPGIAAPQYVTHGAPGVGGQVAGAPQYIQIAVPVQPNAQGQLNPAAVVAHAHPMAIPTPGYTVATHVVGAPQAQA